MSATQNAVLMAITAARAASELKATSIKAIDVSSRLVFTDVFLVLSGSTERQVRAIVDAVDEAVEKSGHPRLRREGLEGEAHWVILDFGDLMVHIQQDTDREFYALEKLWSDCPDIQLPEDIRAYEYDDEESQASDLGQYFDFSDLGN